MKNVNEEIICEIDIVCEKIHDYDIEEIICKHFRIFLKLSKFPLLNSVDIFSSQLKNDTQGSVHASVVGRRDAGPAN